MVAPADNAATIAMPLARYITLAAQRAAVLGRSRCTKTGPVVELTLSESLHGLLFYYETEPLARQDRIPGS